MSGLTQLGRLRILRDSPNHALPWREGDGWLEELASNGWVECSPNGRFYRLSGAGIQLLVRADEQVSHRSINKR
jgi:hypothetical protein